MHTKHAFLKPGELPSRVAHSYDPNPKEEADTGLRMGG